MIVPTWIRSSLCAAAALASLHLQLSSCVSTVTPPEPPLDPVTVQLLSTGRHAGLILPCPDGRTVEYGYGEWRWYALLEDDWWRAPLILFFPRQGTLGRRYLAPGDIGPEGHTYGGGHVASIAVSRERAERLLARLDREFDAGGEPVKNELYDMSFVRYPEGFWLPHLCHDEVAEWLRELGCSVFCAPVRTGLRLRRGTPGPRGP